MKYLIVYFLICFSALAQKQFQFELDYATFPVDEKFSVLELYYSFPQNEMTVQESSGSKIVKGMLSVSVSNTDSKETVLERSWNFSNLIDSSSSSTSLIGLLRFQFDIGNYHGVVTGKDNNNNELSRKIEFDFVIKPYKTEKFNLSDIQLATSIIQDSKNKESMFYKNTLEMTPNPSGIYGKNLPVIFFYSEIHNVTANIQANKLKVDHILATSLDRVVYNKTKFVTRNNASIVDIGAIPINKFPSGIYNLIISVSDTLAEISASSIKRVYVYNPDIIDTTQTTIEDIDLFASELSVLGDPELDLMFEQSKYIAAEAEKSEWNKITTVEGKRAFLNNFWKRRDNIPSTPQNEFKREYFRRVEYANQHYGNFARKEGWKSDFGRVYIMYGIPYEIERHPNELDVKPYEIWFYSDIEGGVVFVFADQSGFGEYRLIHSDKQGELQNYDWQSLINAQ